MQTRMRPLRGSSRNPVIDIARAFAIVGVVYNHTIDGLVGAGILDDSTVLASINDALYVFRMPALAFLLGLFIPRAIRKRGRGGYIRERVTVALYLYIVWFFVQGLVEVATSSVKNSPRELSSLWEIWQPFAHLWFLPFLAIAAILMALTGPRVRKSWAGIGFVCLFVVVSLLAWNWNPNVVGLRGLSLLGFVAVGYVLGLDSLTKATRSSGKAWGLILGLSVLGFCALLPFGPISGTLFVADFDFLVQGLSLISAMLGVLAVLAVSVVVGHIPLLSSLLSLVGQRTLEIYLAHIIVVAGCRYFLQLVSVESALTYVAIAVPLGVAVPMLCFTLAPALKLSWLFRPPLRLLAWSTPNQDISLRSA